MSSTPKGPPKHQNRTAWQPNAGVKKKSKELGGKLHPYPEISGVCSRCKAQIEWRRKYGKYKALNEPAKCNQCSKRAVRQAYHALCSACAKERNICAKCCQPSEMIVGKDDGKGREEKQRLEEALRNLRERDRRTLLRAMNNGTSKAELKCFDGEGSLGDRRKGEKKGEDSEPDGDDWGPSYPEDESESSNATEDSSDKDGEESDGSVSKCLQLHQLELVTSNSLKKEGHKSSVLGLPS